MRRVPLLSVPLLMSLCLVSQVAFAQFHLSGLQYLSVSGAQAGQTIDLSIVGQRLEEVNKLLFSDPAIKATVKTSDPLPFDEEGQVVFGHFSVEVPADTPAGRYEVRAVGRHGVSNPRSFLISNLANVVLSPASHDSNAATKIVQNDLYYAACAAKTSDWYVFEITDEQPKTIELYANRLDSALIGLVEVYDQSGTKVLTSRGGSDIDPSLNIDSLPIGTYKLAIRDFMYRGGPEFHYQLLLRDAGTDSELLKPVDPLSKRLPVHWQPRATTLTNVGNLDPQEIEPTEAAETIESPLELDRWFPPGPDDHHFQFHATKGQQFAIDLVSQRLSQPTDPRLIIERVEPQPSGEPKLHHVLHVDDSPNVSDGTISLGSKDPVTLFTAPEDATYLMSIRDLDIGTTLRPKQNYRLRVRLPNPGFDLVAYRVYPATDSNAFIPFASKLFRGGTEMIRVFALRRDGWSGPIKVSVAGLPNGVTCADAFIATNQNATQLALIANETASGRTDSISITGQSDDGSIAAQAVAVTISQARGHGRGALSTRITTALPVSVSEQDISPLTLRLGDEQIPEVKPGASLSLPIRIVRREGGKTPVILRPVQFPPGIAAGEVTIAADASEGAIELKPNGDAKPATYSIYLQAETKIKLRSNPQALQRAQAYRAKLQSLHDDPAQAANIEAIKTAIVEADKRVEAAKGQANEQELTVFIPTNHTTIRVVQP